MPLIKQECVYGVQKLRFFHLRKQDNAIFSPNFLDSWVLSLVHHGKAEIERHTSVVLTNCHGKHDPKLIPARWRWLRSPGRSSDPMRASRQWAHRPPPSSSPRLTRCPLIIPVTCPCTGCFSLELGCYLRAIPIPM